MCNQNLINSKKEKGKRSSFPFTGVLLLLLCFQFFFSLLSAQIKSVSGVVKDQSGEAIIAASVVVKGTGSGTVTNLDGSYKLDLPAHAEVLVFSYVGMQTEEVKINGDIINVTLKDNAKLLDDVVVIGYGTSKKKRFDRNRRFGRESIFERYSGFICSRSFGR